MAAKSERFALMLSPKDKEQLKRLADARGESRALVVRDLIRDAARSDGEVVQAFSTD